MLTVGHCRFYRNIVSWDCSSLTNIDAEPKFCYKNQIVSALVMLESVASTLLMEVFGGTLINGRSMELTNMVDDVCSIKGDESF